MNVPVHISRHNNGDFVLLEPHRDLEALQLCAARCCVQVNSSQAFIRLINPTFEQVQIPMNFIVANVVEINQGEIVSLEGESILSMLYIQGVQKVKQTATCILI